VLPPARLALSSSAGLGSGHLRRDIALQRGLRSRRSRCFRRDRKCPALVPLRPLAVTFSRQVRGERGLRLLPHGSSLRYGVVEEVTSPSRRPVPRRAGLSRNCTWMSFVVNHTSPKIGLMGGGPELGMFREAAPPEGSSESLLARESVGAQCCCGSRDLGRRR